MRYVFVGESRSKLAIRKGVYWLDGRLAAKPPHDALRYVGLVPEDQVFLNVFQDDSTRISPISIACIKTWSYVGFPIVAMGKRAQQILRMNDIEHLKLVHPAARGSIRKSERYREHVREVLGV